VRQQPSELYRGYRTAGVRFTEEMSADLQTSREASETAALAAYHMYDKAHLVGLAESGAIPMPAAHLMLQALLDMEARGVVAVRSEVGGGMHSGELYLIRTLGEEIGGWAHLARSSADLGAVGDRVLLRERVLETLASVVGLATTLVDLGDREAETLMPVYLHWQQIEPMTLGQYFAAVAEGLMRDLDRGEQAFARINVSPAGAMVHSGSSFAMRADRVASLMGFAQPTHSYFDAFRDWDFVRDAFGFLAPLAGHLTVIGEDVGFWSGSDQQFIRFEDRYMSGSSALMQLRSATLPNQARGILGMVVGGLTAAYMTDAAGSHQALFTRRFGMPPALACFDEILSFLNLFPQMLRSATIDRGRARERSRANLSTLADLAAALVRHRGVPWRTAHQICGILARHCEEDGSWSIDDVDAAALDRASMEYYGRPAELTSAQVAEALDVDAYVRSRDSAGGSAPVRVAEELLRLRSDIARHDAWIAAAYRQLSDADAELAAVVRDLLAKPSV
jgi:argininosuccinate lyase